MKMQELTDSIRQSIIGRVLTKIYQTKQSKPQKLVEGINYAHYFSIIFELDFKDKFKLQFNNISPWTSEEPIFEVTYNNWPIENTTFFIGEKIKDVGLNEHNQIYLLLENDTIIEHTVDWGDGLVIRKYNEFYDKDGKAI